MSSTFNLTAVHVFPCPSCGETINTSMHQCQFCGTAIDPAAAELSAAATSRVSAAVSDASYLKIMAWSLPTFLLIFFIPFLTFAGAMGLVFVTYALPFLCGRWWFKYSSILTTDVDYPKARRTAVIITVIAALNLCRDAATRILR